MGGVFSCLCRQHCSRSDVTDPSRHLVPDRFGCKPFLTRDVSEAVRPKMPFLGAESALGGVSGQGVVCWPPWRKRHDTTKVNHVRTFVHAFEA